MLLNTSCNFGIIIIFVFLLLKIHTHFQKSMHISQIIPESQSSIIKTCRVRDSERNKIYPIILASKIVGLICDSIRKNFPVEANYQRKYKQPPVSLCVRRASLSDFYALDYPKILRDYSLNCIISYQNKKIEFSPESFLKITLKVLLP